MERPTRRAVVKGLSSVLTVGAVGAASGHPSDAEHPTFGEGHDIHRHHETKNTDLVGFHTLGGVGSESVSGGSDRRRLKRLLRTKLHSAGKQYEEAKRA